MLPSVDGRLPLPGLVEPVVPPVPPLICSLLAVQAHELLLPEQVPEAELSLMVPTHVSPFPVKLTLLLDTLPEKAPEEQAKLMEQPCCVTTQVPEEQLPVVGQVPAMLLQLSPPPHDAAAVGSASRQAIITVRLMGFSSRR